MPDPRERQNRPGGLSQAVAQAFAGATQTLPVELAHTYGCGVSGTEVRAQACRGLVALAEARPEVLAQLIRREVQQAFLNALPAYWVRRAEQFEQVGTASAKETANTCRRHAWLLATAGVPDDILAELDDYLGAVVR